MVFKCCTFINLSEINAFTPFTIVLRIKLVQQYGRLKLVTMEMQKLYKTRMGIKYGPKVSTVLKVIGINSHPAWLVFSAYGHCRSSSTTPTI